MNPNDLLAGMTPDVIDKFAQLNAMFKAKRKNKPGPGGIGKSTPSPRRMSTDSASEMPAITQFLSAFGGGGMQ